jgi:hypothetical protein
MGLLYQSVFKRLEDNSDDGIFYLRKTAKKKQILRTQKPDLPEEATHFTDAVDKRIWTKYGNRLYCSSTFIDPRLLA